MNVNELRALARPSSLVGPEGFDLRPTDYEFAGLTAELTARESMLTSNRSRVTNSAHATCTWAEELLGDHFAGPIGGQDSRVMERTGTPIRALSGYASGIENCFPGLKRG